MRVDVSGLNKYSHGTIVVIGLSTDSQPLERKQLKAIVEEIDLAFSCRFKCMIWEEPLQAGGGFCVIY